MARAGLYPGRLLPACIRLNEKLGSTQSLGTTTDRENKRDESVLVMVCFLQH